MSEELWLALTGSVEPVGAQYRVVAGQAACLYSLMRPWQRAVRTSRRGSGWPVVLLSGVVCRGGRWSSERWGRWVMRLRARVASRFVLPRCRQRW